MFGLQFLINSSGNLNQKPLKNYLFKKVFYASSIIFMGKNTTFEDCRFIIKLYEFIKSLLIGYTMKIT